MNCREPNGFRCKRMCILKVKYCASPSFVNRGWLVTDIRINSKSNTNFQENK